MKKFATARTLAVCLLIGAAAPLYAQFPPADPLTRIFFLLKDLETRLTRLENQIKNPGGGDAVVSLKQLQVTLPAPQLPLPPPSDAGPVTRSFAQGPPTMISLPKADVPVRVHFICLSDAFVEVDGVPIKLNRIPAFDREYGFIVFWSTATHTTHERRITEGGIYGGGASGAGISIRTEILVEGEQLAARMFFDISALKPNPVPTVTAIRPISCTLSFWS